MNTQASTLPLSVNPFEALVNAQAAAPAKKSKRTLAKKTLDTKESKQDLEVTRTNPDSKRARAVLIYKESIEAGKKVVIDRFKKELTMTDAGANSYFYATKKAVTQ